MYKRQEKMLSIIKNEKIYTQTELVDRLISEGFDVTQATVSRDLRNLNIIKLKCEDGRSIYSVRKSEEIPKHYLRVLKDGYLSSEPAMNILVIKTVAGMAMAVAAALDAFKFNEVVGCIAGDDTIFVAVKDVLSAVNLKKKIEALF